MVTEQTRKLAKIMQDIANHKIELAEAARNHKLKFSDEEREILYFKAIKDQLGFVFEYCPHISFNDISAALQIEEMIGPDHSYFTTLDLNLDHQPTAEEAREHFINCGRASRFRDYFDKIIEGTT